MVWLSVIGLALGALSIRTCVAHGWRGTGDPDLGWMSQQWLAEYRAGSR